MRRVLSLALFALAAVLAVRDGSTNAAPGTPTVVATHRLPPGSRVRAADVTTVPYPDRLRPAEAFRTVDRVIGRVLGGAAGRGSAITSTSLLGSPKSRAEATTVPIRLADPGIARLLEPGTKVDVVTLAGAGGTGETGGRVLASGVTVVTVTNGARSPGTETDEGPLVLLSVPEDAASDLAAAALSRPVTVTLR